MACPLTQIVPPRRGWWVTPRRRRVVDHLPSTSGPAALTTRGTAWARTALTRAARRRHIFQRREGTTPAAGPDTACPLGANRVLSADGTRAVGGRARAGSPTQGRAARAAGWDQRRRGVGPGRTQATTNGPAPPLGRCRAVRWREIRRSAEVRLVALAEVQFLQRDGDRKSTRLNSSHVAISYAVFCLKKKTHTEFKLESFFMSHKNTSLPAPRVVQFRVIGQRILEAGRRWSGSSANKTAAGRTTNDSR